MPPKIQPVDIDPQEVIPEPARIDSSKPVLKARLKRLFDRQFPGVLRTSTVEKAIGGDGEAQYGKDGAAGEFEPSSVCLAKMVQNFIEGSNEKQAATKCGRSRCNCFNGTSNDSSDDELHIIDGFTDPAASGDISDSLKVLIPCATVAERNLLADTARIVEKNRGQKRKDDLRTIIVENLSSLGYDSSICRSKWDQTLSFPAGEYEYIDVIIGGERLLIDVDFRSEFEIARSTGTYKAILQSLPYIFVGKAERLGQIVSIVSEAARQSLRKKGMHIAPWRKPEYTRAKWLSPYTRTAMAAAEPAVTETAKPEKNGEIGTTADPDGGELQLIFGVDLEQEDGASAAPAPSPQALQPMAIRPKSVGRRSKTVVTGLAALLKEKP